MGLLAEIIAPSIASFLMEKNPWIPLILGILVYVPAVSLVLFIPETLHMRPREVESATLTPDAASELSISVNDEEEKPGFFGTIIIQAVNGLKEVYGSLSVLHSLPILLLLLAFLNQPFSRRSVDLCLRYVSNRFHWELSKAGFLLSLRASVCAVLLFAILPGLSYYLTKHLHFSAREKDTVLARFSVIFLVLGALLIGVSPTIAGTIFGLVVFTLGAGTNSLARSLATSLVDQEHVGRLYAAIGLVETCGGLAAGPTLAALYTLGLRLQGPWVALPFFALAFICLVGAIGIWSFSCVTRKHPGDGIPIDQEDDETTLLNLEAA
jgi:MFS family permease